MFVSTRKASELTGVSAQLLYKLCKEGKIPYIRLGNKFLFDVEQLREALRSEALAAVTQGIEG